jgi:hypothetical protein
LEYPHSLSYHETTLTNFGESWIPAFLSKIEDNGHVTKSYDTTSSSVYPRTPLKAPSEAAFISALI